MLCGCQLSGNGIDKRVIARVPKAIDAELQRVLPAMKRRAGYVAGLDHCIPPDVSVLIEH